MSPPLIAVLNGPNLNMLGVREPEKYGSATLDELEALCAEAAEEMGLAIDFRQTNAEGELITWVQECRGKAAGIIINPAGYTTTSIALAQRPVRIPRSTRPSKWSARLMLRLGMAPPWLREVVSLP